MNNWAQYVKDELDQIALIPFSATSIEVLEELRKQLSIPEVHLRLVRRVKKTNRNFLDELVNMPLHTMVDEHPRRVVIAASKRLLKCMLFSSTGFLSRSAEFENSTDRDRDYVATSFMMGTELEPWKEGTHKRGGVDLAADDLLAHHKQMRQWLSDVYKLEGTPSVLLQARGVASIMKGIFNLITLAKDRDGKIFRLLPLPQLKKANYVHPCFWSFRNLPVGPSVRQHTGGD